MSLDQTLVRRLACVRYLSETAVSQSRAPSPLRCASLLTMHDAVELFLQLASEHLNVGSNQPAFIEYWSLLDKKLAPNEIGHKEGMRRLNKARVALKHNGTFPSDLDVEAFRSTTTNFLEENTALVFSLAFKDISLVQCVNPESARDKLLEAERLLKTGEKLEALDQTALAFAEMILDYERRKQGQYRRSPFYFGIRRGGRAWRMRPSNRGPSSFVSLESYIDKIGESVEAIQHAMTILALGVDYRKYARFSMLTPHVVRHVDGEWILYHRGSEEAGDEESTGEDVRFCCDLVVETALALAEFDYTVPTG